MATRTQSEIAPPEQYVLPATKYCPNSKMPVLVYRNVLPSPRTPETAQAWVEKHGWLKQVSISSSRSGNVSSSDVLMGIGTSDGAATEEGNKSKNGLLLTLKEGDVIVHPAGTGHSNVSDEGNYRYLSFFPEGSPRWISENGDKLLDDHPEVSEQIAQVPMPRDPVTGDEGYLVPLWGSFGGN
ncbi:hypothetical protein NW762_010667 [Fusarium torreyae]|uniref:Cupin type-1 domain-containing protein n=1 Tax=Fusarium torreyae TaxID=1237075 RepID=A0A9W8RQQ5_9HYPO|nr:hypothetical protein NW762_010667 [Fusarium torreyae]